MGMLSWVETNRDTSRYLGGYSASRCNGFLWRLSFWKINNRQVNGKAARLSHQALLSSVIR